MNRTHVWRLVAAALLAALVPTSALAQSTPASCRAEASSYAQQFVSPQPSGDEDFFTKPSGPPNIMFLLGNNVSMQNFPNPIPAPGNFPDGGAPIGCADNAMGAGITDTYFNNNTDGKSVLDTTYDHEFNTDPTKSYSSFTTRLPWDGNGGVENGITTHTDFSKGFYDAQPATGDNTVCGKSDGTKSDLATLAGIDSTTWGTQYYSLCQSCMSTKGWFRGPKVNSTVGYVYGLSGRFLNKYPPKYAIARKVISDVFKAAGPVRLGIAVLTTDNAYFDPAKYLFNGGGSMMTPACDKALAGTGFNDDRPQLQNALKNVQYTEQQHGLGEALFSIGGYYADQTTWTNWFQTVPGVEASDDNWYPGTNGGWSDGPNMWIDGYSAAAQQVFESGGTQHMSICFPCQVTSVIVLSDSTPDADNSVPVTKMDQLAGMPVNAGNANPGGVNTCVNFCGGIGNAACKSQCDNGQSPQGPDPGNKNFMDDVAYFLAHVDLRPVASMPGNQNVFTYTILFGSTPDPMLEGMAQAGLGKSYTSTDETSLESAIFQAIADIAARSTSGSVPALSNVQASSTSTAYIPRFHPVNGKAFWPGDIDAYELYNEQIAKCTPGGAGDLDKDGTCTGIYLIDQNLKRIGADVAGQINSQLPGQYYEVNSSGNLTATHAVPFWSAAARLGARDPGTRQVFTVVDTTNDGDVMGPVNGAGSDDGALAFTPANWQALLPYLGIANDPNFCSDFAAKAGIPAIANDATYQTCAQMLIKFVLGYDVLNEENISNTDGGYPWTNLARGSVNSNWSGLGYEDEILGDIFHSPPVVVRYAEPEKVCEELGGPCLHTLFQSPTPIAVSGGKDAYQQWLASEITNKQADAIVVGANDGMLHVFKADCWYDNFVDPNLQVNASAGTFPSANLPSGYSGSPYKCASVTSGSAAGGLPGDELFAFIPTDLLPKLKNLVGITHSYFVDGEAYYRHIWVDGLQSNNTVSGTDNMKQSGEYRDVIVMGERTGGTHFFALDLTDPLAGAEGRASDGMHTAGGAQRFMWLYPRLSSPDEISFGETWNGVSPSPPPFGPIRLKQSGGLPYNVGGTSSTYVEKWAVFLNGGNDALGIRGRGLYVVDAWTGATLKKFTPLTGVSNMLYPFPAAIGAFNWGDNAQQVTVPDDKDFWDTATVGDVGGQVWTMRFYDPDPAKWALGRALQEAKSDNSNERHRFPIYDLTVNAPTPSGYLRTIVGTGDRQHLHETDVGTCGFGNLRACVTQGCDVEVAGGYASGTDVLSAHYQYGGGGTRQSAQEVYASTSPLTQFSLLGLPNGATACAASLATSPTVHISGGPCTDTKDQPLGEWVCSDDASQISSLFSGGVTGIIANDGGGPLCFEQSSDRSSNNSNYSPPALTSSTYNLRNRMMSFRLFDTTGSRQVFDTTSAANTYDGAALDDLQDLTVVSSNFQDGGFATETDKGWYLPYSVYDERDSSSPEYVAGCVLWNTVEGGVYCTQNSDCCDNLADGGVDSACGSTCNTSLHECQSISPCSKIGSSSQFTYSADYISGNGGCGVAFQQGTSDGGTNALRRVTCTQNCDSMPSHGDPIIRFIDQNGEVRTSVINPQAQNLSDLQITQPDDLMQLLYTVPISPDVHDCRHLGNCH